MTNRLYSEAVNRLEQLLPPRAVSRSLRQGLAEAGATPADVELEQLTAILEGPVLQALERTMSPERAREQVEALVKDLQTAAGATRTSRRSSAPRPTADQEERDRAVAELREAMRPFNLYFEWPEVQGLRSRLRTIEEERPAGEELETLVRQAHGDLERLRGKLDEHLQAQLGQLAQLRALLAELGHLDSPKVRRLEHLIGQIDAAQRERQLAGAEIERAQSLAEGLRGLGTAESPGEQQAKESPAGSYGVAGPHTERPSPATVPAAATRSTGDLRVLAQEVAQLREYRVAGHEELGELLERARALPEGEGREQVVGELADRIERIETAVNERFATLPVRAEEAMNRLRRVGRLNNEGVAEVRRTLDYLWANRTVRAQQSLILKLEMESSLARAQQQLQMLEQEYQTARDVAGKLVSGGAVEGLLGMFGEADTRAQPGSTVEPPAGEVEEFELGTLSDTRQLALHLSRRLPEGALLLVSGPLGAGKTTLVALLAEVLGSEAAVSSPTYTLVHEYPTEAGRLVHLDLYRLPDPAAGAEELGLDEYLDGSRLVVVEWGDSIAARYPEAWQLQLERTDLVRRARLLPPRPEAGA